MTYKELQAAVEDGMVLVHRHARDEHFVKGLKVWRDPVAGRMAQLVGYGKVSRHSLPFLLTEEQWEDLRPVNAEELLLETWNYERRR